MSFDKNLNFFSSLQVFYAFFSCTENADATKEVFPAPVPGLGTGPPGTTLLQDIPCN